MSEYNWREHWEEINEAGEAIELCIKLPDGRLLYQLAINGKCYWMCSPDGTSLHGLAKKSLIPKKKLRPWTAKEWGSRIGDEFVLNDNRVKLIAVARTTLCFEGASEHFPLHGPQYAARQDDKEITQLDGSPCGEYE